MLMNRHNIYGQTNFFYEIWRIISLLIPDESYLLAFSVFYLAVYAPL
ncbi:hypothetical protein HMPREF9148_01039 [Prevotella sp. F0091]|nr:hypothetical protein HMPREF9148_01039 [Prevotella sp. F0091]